MLLTAVLIPAEEGGFIALNPETGTTSQGESVEEAVANLREATELYLEEFPLKTSGQPLVTTFQVEVNATEPDALEPHVWEGDDDHVIFWMLSLTPTQRVEVAQGFVDGVVMLRNGLRS
jgi:predicted RNase H-like HicB family nuclease